MNFVLRFYFMLRSKKCRAETSKNIASVKNNILYTKTHLNTKFSRFKKNLL